MSPPLLFKTLSNFIHVSHKTVDRALTTANDMRKSSKSMPFDFSVRRRAQPAKPCPELPSPVWDHICDYLTPIEESRLRRVNRQLRNVVEERRKTRVYLDVVKCDLGDVDPSQFDGPLYRHPKYNILLHVNKRSGFVIVDDRWTARDAAALFRIVDFFAPHAHYITIDAQVMELLVVGLSSLKISRWHAFESYIQAIGPVISDELHMRCTKNTPVRGPLFPCAKEVTVRSLTSNLPHLCRIEDYNVPLDALVDVDCMQLFRVNVVDNAASRKAELGASAKFVKRPCQYLAVFKRWVHSAALAEKYAQQYS